jgi:hypothetical protein
VSVGILPDTEALDLERPSLFLPQPKPRAPDLPWPNNNLQRVNPRGLHT